MSYLSLLNMCYSYYVPDACTPQEIGQGNAEIEDLTSGLNEAEAQSTLDSFLVGGEISDDQSSEVDGVSGMEDGVVSGAHPGVEDDVVSGAHAGVEEGVVSGAQG